MEEAATCSFADRRADVIGSEESIDRGRPARASFLQLGIQMLDERNCRGSVIRTVLMKMTSRGRRMPPCGPRAAPPRREVGAEAKARTAAVAPACRCLLLFVHHGVVDGLPLGVFARCNVGPRHAVARNDLRRGRRDLAVDASRVLVVTGAGALVRPRRIGRGTLDGNVLAVHVREDFEVARRAGGAYRIGRDFQTTRQGFPCADRELGRHAGTVTWTWPY